MRSGGREGAKDMLGGRGRRVGKDWGIHGGRDGVWVQKHEDIMEGNGKGEEEVK